MLADRGLVTLLFAQDTNEYLFCQMFDSENFSPMKIIPILSCSLYPVLIGNHSRSVTEQLCKAKL